jgi:uncharacterized protein YbaP (TraB family)
VHPLLSLTYRNFLVVMVQVISAGIFAQPTYQSLFWEVTGNGLKKPSYLYGTMHISGKLAFELGDPFYDAMQTADVVALELEPEEWLNAVFNDPQVVSMLNESGSDESYYDYDSDSPLPNLKGVWKLGGDLSLTEQLSEALAFNPPVLNYLMYRYGSGGADYEEDTWLDMYIYQTAKKMGRQTMGLETYAQSDEFIRKAGADNAREMDNREWDEGDIQELEELYRQLEPAYRRQDLDFIDSLSRNATPKSFLTYILLERNKLFVQKIDSVCSSGKTVFAAMGCAHLPGDGGVIESLRSKGYIVKPINKGNRNSKRRKEIDKRVFEHESKPFTTPDGRITVSLPSSTNHVAANEHSSTWMSLDMPNSASFTITRIKNYSALTKYNSNGIFSMLDSVMYEAVAGELISKSIKRVGEYQGIDVLNKTRRGDYQRQVVIPLSDELVILKVAATGEKVRSGYGAFFFDEVQIDELTNGKNRWLSPDGSVSVELPARRISYENPSSSLSQEADFEVNASTPDNETYYYVRRHVIEFPGFLDEDQYELNRFLRAYCDDRQFQVVSSRTISQEGRTILQAELSGLHGKEHARFIVNGLSYIVMATNSAEESNRMEWFGSLQIQNPIYLQYMTYTHPELHFTTKLPYTPQSTFDADVFNPDLDEDQDSPFGTNASVTLQPPGAAHIIQIDFQRYHEYSDGEDKVVFQREKRDLVLGVDMNMISEEINWSENGATFTFIVGDTLTTRRFMHRMVLFNKSFYHLSTCYDSVSGVPDFVKIAFENFRSTDTIFPFPHFEIRDNAYFDALISPDSILRNRALQITGEMDFSQESVGRMRTLLSDLPFFTGEDATHVKAKLVTGLAADTSRSNVDFIAKEFVSYPDSASYQYELLAVLLRIKTEYAWRTYARLVVEEPPIVFDEMGGSGCEALFDSVKLAGPLIPRLMQLLAIDEYEESIYHLMAVAADSNWLHVESYKYLIPQILVEARNELKRLKSSAEEGYGFNTDLLLDYCSLLQPARKEKEVATFFSKAYAANRGELLVDLMRFDWEHGLAPSDSLISRISRMKNQVHTLYGILWDNGSVGRMPSTLSTRESLAGLYLKNKYEENEERIDSVMLLKSQIMVIRGKSVEVRFYKVFKPESNQWMGHVLAFDASVPQNAWPGFVESERTVVLDEDEDALVELEREFLYLEELNREYINFGAGASDFSVHWY